MTEAKKKAILRFWQEHDFSLQMIADKFRVTRGQVSGLIFRHRHPVSQRIPSKPGGSRNKIINGRHGGHNPAASNNLYFRCGRRAEGAVQ